MKITISFERTRLPQTVVDFWQGQIDLAYQNIEAGLRQAAEQVAAGEVADISKMLRWHADEMLEAQHFIEQSDSVLKDLQTAEEFSASIEEALEREIEEMTARLIRENLDTRDSFQQAEHAAKFQARRKILTNLKAAHKKLNQ